MTNGMWLPFFLKWGVCLHSLVMYLDPARGEGLRAGFPLYLFTGVEAADARTSTEVHIKQVAAEAGINYRARFFHQGPEFLEALRGGELDFVLISAVDFIREPGLRLKPLLVTVRGEAPQDRLRLLVRADAGIKTLADLRGRSLALDCGADTALHFLWLDEQLKREGLPPAREFFAGRTEFPQEASRVVLPVFEGAIDACLVSESQFNLMLVEYPELGRELISLTYSVPLLNSIVCVHEDYRETEPGEIMRLGGTLTQSPAGREFLSLTKTKRMAPFQPEYLDNVRQLLN